MAPEVIAAIIAAVATLAAAIVGATVSLTKKRERDKRESIEVIVYKNSGEYISAFEARIRKAKRVDDVTWGEGEANDEIQWSRQDRIAHRHLYETIAEIIRKPDVIWRDVVVLSSKYRSRFELYKEFVLNPDAPGYSLAYFESPPPTAPPRIGFSVVDSGEDDAEVFLAFGGSRLRMKHPDIVAFFSQYFGFVLKRATQLKRGTTVNHEMLENLERQIMEQEGDIE